MKKFYSLLMLSVLLLPGCNNKQKGPKEDPNPMTIEEAKMYDASASVKGKVNIYKFKETNDVPYLNVAEAMTAFGYQSSSVTFPDDNHVSVNNTMNNASISFDLVNKKATIDDIISFSSRFETTYDYPQVLEEERMWNLQLDEEKYVGLPSKVAFTLDYGLYGFHVYLRDGAFYIPFSVFNLLTKSFEISDYYSNYAFNGKDIFPIESSLSVYSTLGKKYYGSGYAGTEMTPEMAEYNYQSTCMIFDNLYRFDKSGVGEITHEEGVSFFDKYFTEHNMKADLSGTDQDKFDKTFAKFIEGILDDPHTSLMYRSVYFGKDVGSHSHSGGSGPRNSAYYSSYFQFYSAKSSVSNAVENNFKISGKTGIISFNNFMNIAPSEFNPYENKWTSSYYGADTSLLFYDAFKAFDAKGTIENIVIDISTNTGGSSGTLAQLMQYLYEDPHIITNNLFGNVIEDKVLHADTNFDGVFDEKDCYRGKYNFYILISPVSFSCGNFFPAVCKQTKCATIIGQKSGGGSCVVYQTALPNGTIFQMSGMQEICYDPNGGTDYIDDDAGIEPDYAYGVGSIADYYNYSKLNTFVSNLSNNN